MLMLSKLGLTLTLYAHFKNNILFTAGVALLCLGHSIFLLRLSSLTNNCVAHHQSKHAILAQVFKKKSGVSSQGIQSKYEVGSRMLQLSRWLADTDCDIATQSNLKVIDTKYHKQ